MTWLKVLLILTILLGLLLLALIIAVGYLEKKE